MSIYCRSPYIIEIDEPSQEGAKVELYAYNSGGSLPTNPTDSLSKLIASSSNTLLTFNISPFLRRFIKHDTTEPNYLTPLDTPSDRYCIVQIKRYKLISGSYVLIDTSDQFVFDGWGYYADGYNPNLSVSHLPEGSYNYHYDPNNDPATNNIERAGNLTIENALGWQVRWTNLSTGFSITQSTGTGKVVDIPVVNSSMYDVGNTLEILDAVNTVLFTYTFRPVTECRYDPVICDFVNKWGAWQRFVFYKANKQSIETKSNAYNLMQTDLVNYDIREGQRKEFNLNGIESITVNTGFQGEGIGEIIRQLMLSERILLNDRPVKLKTRSQEIMQEVNMKNINYQLSFEYAYDTINNVV